MSSTLQDELSLIPNRVAAGIAWLDTRDRAWREKLSHTALDLGHPTQCILSQVFGAWLSVTLSRAQYIEYGFLAPDGLTGFTPEPFDARDGYYYALTNRWKLVS